jgi:hypothetical protein
MAEHGLKCWSNFYDAIADGTKTFEWRFDDRGFEVGDVLVLRRQVYWDYGLAGKGWEPDRMPGSEYKLVEQRVRVTYILRGQFGVPPGFCVMGIARIGDDAQEQIRLLREKIAQLKEELGAHEEGFADDENAIHEAGFPVETAPADAIRQLTAQVKAATRAAESARESVELTAAEVRSSEERCLNTLRYIRKHLTQDYVPGMAPSGERDALVDAICHGLHRLRAEIKQRDEEDRELIGIVDKMAGHD